MKLAFGVRMAVLASVVLLIVVVGACSAVAPVPPKGVAPPTDMAPASGGAYAPAWSSATTNAPGQRTADQENTAGTWDRMIIRTLSLSMVVRDVESSIAAVRDIAGGAGGLIAQSNTRYDGDHQLATITLQVPAAQFDATVAALRQLAVKVETENGTSQDVTEEYTDLAAQVRNFQATETSLQRLMDKATSMQDIITLQRELTSVRGEIERRQGRMQYLARRSDMSTITVSLKPEALAKSRQAQMWQPLETARNAWEASQTVLLAIANVLIALIVFLWWLIPVALIAGYIMRGRRGRRRPGASAPTALP